MPLAPGEPGARNGQAAVLVLRLALVTALAMTLSAQPLGLAWALGQVLLVLCFVQAFIVLHEAGHGTLFSRGWANTLVGHVAGVVAGFPFYTWRSVHHQHHRWTGWQDLDPTTAVLADQHPGPWFRRAANLCWKLWIPVFSLSYRLQNYWHPTRLWRLFPRPSHRRRHLGNIVVLLALYALILALLGPARSLAMFALPLWLTHQVLDVLLLSQHTHIPMKLARGRNVAPLSYEEQVEYTRSLLFPAWFSRLVLLGFDAHELHHAHPRVPGYRLAEIRRPMPNEVPWWQFVRAAKGTPADVFLFSNRNESGLSL